MSLHFFNLTLLICSEVECSETEVIKIFFAKNIVAPLHFTFIYSSMMFSHAERSNDVNDVIMFF